MMVFQERGKKTNQAMVRKERNERQSKSKKQKEKKRGGKE